MGTLYQPLESTIQDLKVTIHNTSLVFPSQETPKKPMFLPNIDQVLNFDVQTLHFFNANPEFPPEIVTERLRIALSRVLVPYDFLAGRLRMNQESKRLEFDCNSDAGAVFMVASSELTLNEIGDLVYPNPGFRQLIVHENIDILEKDDKPLCILQVTSFKCGGFAMGFSTNHITFDGISFKTFLQNLASQAFDDDNNNPKPLAIVPCNDRTLLAARRPPRVTFPHVELLKLDVPIGEELNAKVFETLQEELDFKIFKFNPSDINSLKEKAKDENTPNAKITSFNVVTSYVWRCKALSYDDENNSERVSTVLFAVDIRPRLNPPLPQSYAGNAVLTSYASATCHELEEGPFSKIVDLVSQGGKRMDDEYARSAIDCLPTDGPISNAQKIFLNSLPSSMDYHLLPPVNFDDLPEDVKIETRISLTVSRSLTSLRQVLESIIESKKTVALVVDLFGTDAFDVAIDLKISPYIFFPSTAMGLSLFLHLPNLDETVSCEYRDLPDPIQIPGCTPIHGKDLLDPVQDRNDESYKWLLHHAKRYGMAEGIIVNSFKELEGGAIGALQKDEPGKPTVYPVGPLIQMDSGSKVDGSECMTWLDEQPRGSVLYISYGSGGTLSHEQLIEVAAGLEMSEQRFLWVVRCPNDKIANATFFNVQDSTNPLEFLPKGFLERTKGFGLVLPNWAPQARILSHESTGGFLTHCGWNSTLESVVHGVPLIAWPLYAEQKMNAVMLSEDIKVALRPKVNEENGIVGRLEIAKVVKGLMEGEEGKGVRSRMRDLKDAAAKVLSEDGSSTKALAELATKLRKKCQMIDVANH